MAGGRKGSHKGKSHQKKKENSCESIEETTCAASEASLFLATPSNPAKRCRTEETDEFNPEETLKIFESLMQKCENTRSPFDMCAKISLAYQFVVNYLPLVVDFIKSQKGVIEMKRKIEKQETEIKTLKEELLKGQIPKSQLQRVKSTNEQLKVQEKEIKALKKEVFKCKKSTREQIELQETETEALKEELAEELLNCQLSKSTKNQLELQETEIMTLKRELLNCQITNSTKSVIVKNLEPESDRESPKQLCTTFNKVLNDMGIQKETTVCDIFRIKSKSPPPTAPQIAVHEPVKITFLNKLQKSNFLKNLKNLKTYKNLKVSIDCPSLLLPEYKTASKKAHDIRTNKPGTQTILTIKNQKNCHPY